MHMRRRGAGCGLLITVIFVFLVTRACSPATQPLRTSTELSNNGPLPTAIHETSATTMPRPADTMLPVAPSTTVPTLITTATVMADELKMRSAPGVSFASLGVYPKGTVAVVLGKDLNETWLKVNTPDGEVGWMASEYLSITGVLTKIPIVGLSGQYEPGQTIRGTQLGRDFAGRKYTQSAPFGLVKGDYQFHSEAPLYNDKNEVLSSCQHNVTLYSLRDGESYNSDGSPYYTTLHDLHGMYYIRGTSVCDWVVTLKPLHNS